MYISVTTKFSLALILALIWGVLCYYIDLPWIGELAEAIGYPLAVVVIMGIAIVPGVMNVFMLTSLLLDKRPRHKPLEVYPAITILIAAYNEESGITETLESIEAQQYPGKLDVLVIDDGSKDATVEKVQAVLPRYPWLRLLQMPVNGGKAKALNHGLKHSRHKLVVTLDADSYLYRNSLQCLIGQYVGDPPNTRAVAGAIVVRNSRKNWISKAQEWDYFHGISAIKRTQSLYQGTLVAQGAYSIYDRDTLLDVGGWPDCVGEDIVLSWAILKAGYRIGHCETAYAFTNVPETLLQFSRQRQRWARGAIEAFKVHPGILLKPRLATFYIYWNLLFPLLDLIFTLAFLPGIVLALFGYYGIIGPLTLALLPIALLMNYTMFLIGRKTFSARGLKVRANIAGFFMYSLLYSVIMQPICAVGYYSELLNLKKQWGTK